MGLSSFKFVNLFCNRVRFGRSRSSEVADFGTNRKRACDFLFVPHCDYMVLSCTVSEIRRIIVKKMLIFSTPSHSAPSLPGPMFPLEFHVEVNSEETRVIWAILQ